LCDYIEWHQNAGRAVRDHVKDVNIGMAKDTAKGPSAMGKKHKMYGILANAKNAN
jgi:hypothetical protein